MHYNSLVFVARVFSLYKLKDLHYIKLDLLQYTEARKKES